MFYFSFVILAISAVPFVENRELCRCEYPKIGQNVIKIEDFKTTNVGEEWTFVCAPNYFMRGNATIKCTGRGWNSPPPACVDKNLRTCDARRQKPKTRVDCGYGGISKEECLTRNCCWDSSILDVNWCFFHDQKSYAIPDEKHCYQTQRSIHGKVVNCGYDNIRQEECNNRGCCFDETRESEKCFFSIFSCQFKVEIFVIFLTVCYFRTLKI